MHMGATSELGLVWQRTYLVLCMGLMRAPWIGATLGSIVCGGFGFGGLLLRRVLFNPKKLYTLRSIENRCNPRS